MKLINLTWTSFHDAAIEVWSPPKAVCCSPNICMWLRVMRNSTPPYSKPLLSAKCTRYFTVEKNYLPSCQDTYRSLAVGEIAVPLLS